jgi:hypothetical protein
MMHHRTQRLSIRLAAVTVGAMLSAAAASTAGAAECDGGFGSFLCAVGTSSANVNAFLERPVDRPAFYHIEIDMTGGDIAAVAYAVDENGNQLTDFDQVVADKNAFPGQFTPIPYADLFGGGSGDVDQVAEFTYPLDLQILHVTVI